jgi:hypothetical protein
MGGTGRMGGMGRIGTCASVVALMLLSPARHFPAVVAQQNQNAIANFVKVNARVIALMHVRIIDGTGAPAREDRTLVISGENVTAIGEASRVAVPADATIVDLTGKVSSPDS